MPTKTVPKHQHPLDLFLPQLEEAPASELGFLVREYAVQPYKAEGFRSELTNKLKRLHYPQPADASIGEKRTFAQVLEHGGVLSTLLSEDTLRELWKSLVLKKVFERSRELHDKRQSVLGVPLEEHWRRAREVQKDINILKKLDAKYDLPYTLPQYDKMSERSFGDLIAISRSGRRSHGRTLLSFTLHVPEWKKKLRRKGRRRITKSSADQPSPTSRIEDKRIQALIYGTLEQRLQNPLTYHNGIDDTFLCQLAELVWAPADVRALSSGESLRRDINRWRS